MKRCSGCKESKEVEEFYKHRTQQDGLDYYCKECRKKTTVKSHKNENKQRCTMEGCEVRQYARDLCRAHYERLRTTGDPRRKSELPKPECSVEGCEKASVSLGLCKSHHSKHWRESTAGTRDGVWDTEPVSYAMAHARVVLARGMIGDHVCACGVQAENWSLKPDTPLDRLRFHPIGNREKPSAVSVSVWDYEPYCSACHKTLDAETGNRNYITKPSRWAA